MKLLHKTLIVIFLFPVLFLIVISTANLENKTPIKILNFKSIELPIGIWMIIGTTSGALLGASVVKYSLQSGARDNLQATNSNYSIPHYPEDFKEEDIDYETPMPEQFDNIVSDYQPLPERDIKDPAPTLSVPFRILKKGNINNYSNSIIHEQDDLISYQTNDREPELRSTINNDDWDCKVSDSW